MGEGLRIKCQTCLAKQDFLLGVGMLYSEVDPLVWTA